MSESGLEDFKALLQGGFRHLSDSRDSGGTHEILIHLNDQEDLAAKCKCGGWKMEAEAPETE